MKSKEEDITEKASREATVKKKNKELSYCAYEPGAWACNICKSL